MMRTHAIYALLVLGSPMLNPAIVFAEDLGAASGKLVQLNVTGVAAPNGPGGHGGGPGGGFGGGGHPGGGGAPGGGHPGGLGGGGFGGGGHPGGPGGGFPGNPGHGGPGGGFPGNPGHGGNPGGGPGHGGPGGGFPGGPGHGGNPGGGPGHGGPGGGFPGNPGHGGNPGGGPGHGGPGGGFPGNPGHGGNPGGGPGHGGPGGGFPGNPGHGGNPGGGPGHGGPGGGFPGGPGHGGNPGGGPGHGGPGGGFPGGPGHGGNPGGGPGHGGPGGIHNGPDHGWHDHRGDVDHARQNHRGDLDGHRRGIDDHRNVWDRNHRFHFGGDVHRGDRDYWRDRLNIWWDVCPRPIYRPIPGYVWWVPMPVYGLWDYYQVETVAENLEYLSQKIYDVMTDPNVPYVNPSYQARLFTALSGLVGAADNYDDAVRNSIDWDGSLDDLFFLDQQLSEVENTLNGFSQAYRVQPDLEQFRYYVNELLWQYHQEY